MTSRLEVLGVVPGPGTAARQPVARQRGPDRRFLERRRSCPSPSQAGAPAVGVEQRHGVIVVTPVGTLPDPLPARLVEQLEASIAARPVIIDLSQTTLVSAAPVVGLTGWVLGASHQPAQCCVVCPRVTARALLRRWHVTRCVAIFGSVGDALQARRFADDGDGAGWHPDPPGRSPSKSES
jgi:hypothetical protein